MDGHEEYILYVISKFLDLNWLGKHFQYEVTYEGYGKEHDEWLFRDSLLEDLGLESLLDYENDFYTVEDTQGQSSIQMKSGPEQRAEDLLRRDKKTCSGTYSDSKN